VGRHQTAAVEEDGHGGQRHDQRLQQLERRVAVLERADRQRDAGYEGIELSVPRADAMEQRERSVAPEVECALGVDRFVRHDPEAVHAAARQPVQQR
jgi:hypothetical protein